MTESERIGLLSDAIATAFNQALPESIPVDIAQDIHEKNSVIAESIANAINVFCKQLSVEINLTNEATRKVLGVSNDVSNIETNLPVYIPGSYVQNAVSKLSKNAIGEIFRNSNEGSGTIKINGTVK